MVETDTDDRKKRLAAMRSGQQIDSKVGSKNADIDEVRLRNYVPYDANLALSSSDHRNQSEDNVDDEDIGNQAKRQKGVDGSVTITKRRYDNRGTDKVENTGGIELIKAELNKTAKQIQQGARTSGGTAAGPVVVQKIDHDLKLQAADKLAKLQKRTHRAIVGILRDKLNASDE